MNILCENIRAYRKALGMTQKELSEQLGISDKTVSRWESGVQLPEASLLPQIAEVLNVTIDELYGLEHEATNYSESPQKDERKILTDFKIWMIAGTLISLLGSLLYRYFGSTVFLAPHIIDVDYYNTAKGMTADIFTFAGIVAIFTGIIILIIAKVRLTIQFKPVMPTSIFAANVRYTGAAVIAFAVIFMKTAPEILSFGYFLPRSVYGNIFIAALTAVLLWYQHQLKKREIAVAKSVSIIALIIGGISIVMSIATLIMQDYLALTVYTDSSLSGSSTASGVFIGAILLSVTDWLILAMPIMIYIGLLTKIRKV